MAVYVSYDDVVLGHDALTREPLTKAVVCGLILESETKVEADLSGYLDIRRIREMFDPHPVLKVLALAMSRSRAYSSVHGSNLPEEGGQVSKWREEYDSLLAEVLSGKYDHAFGDIILEPRRTGTVRAV